MRPDPAADLPAGYRAAICPCSAVSSMHQPHVSTLATIPLKGREIFYALFRLLNQASFVK